MAHVVQVGTEEVDQFIFDKILGQFLGGFAVVSDKREHVNLKQTTRIADLFIDLLVIPEIRIALGMRQHRLIIIHLHFKQSQY